MDVTCNSNAQFAYSGQLVRSGGIITTYRKYQNFTKYDR